MATFPTSPSVNDTVTMGDVTYKWNGNGWQVDVGSGGGGGSSEWTDTGGTIHPTETADTVAIGASSGDTNAKLSVDGAGAYKSQSSAPTSTTGYAKIYSKEVADDVAGNHLFHFNNALTDSGSGSATLTHNGTYNGAPAYSTTSKFGSHSMSFDTSGGGDFVKIPYSANLSWDGEFTCDFWVKVDSSLHNGSGAYTICCESRVDGGSIKKGLSIRGYGKTHSTRPRYWSVMLASSSDTSNPDGAMGIFKYYNEDAHVSDTDFLANFQHIAVCRDSTGVVRMWLNGKEMTFNNGYRSESSTQLKSTATVNGNSNDLTIGRDQTWTLTSDNTQSASEDFKGLLDEFRIVKGSAEFSGDSWSPPTSPYGGTTTQLFCSNDSGAEFQLTKAYEPAT